MQTLFQQGQVSVNASRASVHCVVVIPTRCRARKSFRKDQCHEYPPPCTSATICQTTLVAMAEACTLEFYDKKESSTHPSPEHQNDKP